MGWTSSPEWQTKQQALEGDLDMPILDKSFIGNVAYVAVQKENGQVFGLVAMFSKDSTGYAVKLVDESMGPYQFDCPKRILDKLTPLDELYEEGRGTYAKEWREACYSLHAKPKVRLEDGMRVRFANMMDFGSFEANEFMVVKRDRKVLFQTDDGILCRVPGYTKKPFEVVKGE